MKRSPAKTSKAERNESRPKDGRSITPSSIGWRTSRMGVCQRKFSWTIRHNTGGLAGRDHGAGVLERRGSDPVISKAPQGAWTRQVWEAKQKP